MAGLLDIFGDEETAMAVAAGLLSGKGFAGGAAAWADGIARKKDRDGKQGLLALQMESGRMDNDAKRQAMEEARRRQDFIQNLPSPQAAASQQALAGGGGPTVANAARMPQVSPNQDLMYQGVRAGAVGLPDYLKSMQPREDEWSPTPHVVRDPNTGQLVNVLISKSGQQKVLPYGPKPDIQMQDLGGEVRAIDKNSVTGGQSFQRTGNPFNDLLLNGPNGGMVPNQPLINAKAQVASAGAPKVEVNTGQKGLDNELKIRSDFRSEPIYKAHQEVVSAHSQITQALKQASPAGDLAGATKLMKILDPGSVVRESELGMAMAASGAMDRLQHYATNIMNGTKLTPTQRADFQKLSDSLMGESVKQYGAKRDEYGQFAKSYGLDADRILGPIPSAATQSKPLDKLPPANASNKGKVATNSETGERFRSNGFSWVKE